MEKPSLERATDGPPRKPWRPFISGRGDFLAIAPAGFYLFGVAGDPTYIALAYLCWGFCVLAFTSIVVGMAAVNEAPGEGARAGAIVGIGLTPWLLLPPFIDVFTSPAGFAFIFPIIYLGGGATLLMAALDWPPVPDLRTRFRLFIAGVVVYSLLGLEFLGFEAMGLAANDPAPAILAVPLFIAGCASLYGAFALSRSARRVGRSIRRHAVDASSAPAAGDP